tara:strand:- start:80 stop:1963 length:1884 start_codon:yes stop_codon:yes gene_type:complete
MNTVCAIVIGHVDHGKTSLVRALTGTDTDRLALEKQRGLSITLGFAHCDFPAGTVDLIDAPGHQDFTRAMVAGATGAQTALLVVSAIDGVAPQTLEHLRIMGVLGVGVGVVAVTKVDLVPAAQLSAKLDLIRSQLAALGVSEVPFIPCSANCPDRLAAVQQALGALLTMQWPSRAPVDAFLSIDRAFMLPGKGTVVTGTLLGAPLGTDGTFALQPQGTPVSVRSVQSRGQPRDVVHPGERVAVNLRGLAVQDVSQGSVLCTADAFKASNCMDVHIAVLPDAARALKHMHELRAMFGTSQEVVTVRLMGGGQVSPGQSGFAQIRFRRKTVGFAGQRVVLRSLSPAVTMGGAVILDPQAQPVRSGDVARLNLMRAAVARDARLIAAALCHQGKGLAALEDVERVARLPRGSALGRLAGTFTCIASGHIAQTPDLLEARSDVISALQSFHAAHPVKRLAPRRTIEQRSRFFGLLPYVEKGLIADRKLRVEDGQVALTAHDPLAAMNDAQRMRLAEIAAWFTKAGMAPSDAAQFSDADDPDLVALLVASGTLVSLHNVALNQRVLFHAECVVQAVSRLRDIFPPPERFTTSQARSALTTTRKFIVPLLEHLDSLGITRRDGDTRQMNTQAH